MNINDYINSRVLLNLSNQTRWSSPSTVSEYKVLEVSPSGNWVKLMDLNGKRFWCTVSSISFVEALKSFDKEIK